MYALSADETSPAFMESHAAQLQPCFPAASNLFAVPGGTCVFAEMPGERITRYALQAKSCAKVQTPLGFRDNKTG